MATRYYPSPYYDEQDTIIGFGVWDSKFNDWVLDHASDYTEAQAQVVADNLNANC